jgi:hypothetical protein
MKKIDIPRLETLSETFAGLLQRRADLGRELADKFAAHLELAHTPDEQVVADPAASRVAALLGEPPAAIAKSKRERLAVSAQEQRDLRTAIELLDRRLAVEKSKVSAVVREMVRPEFNVRLKAVSEALLALHKAALSHTELVDQLEAGGFELGDLTGWYGRSHGHPRDPHSPIATDLARAVELGVIKRSAVPAELAP